MAHAILMPKPGQMTEECVLLLWRKDEGEAVHKGDVLFEIETDKSAMEVESFEEGVLLKRVVDEGATVPVNTVCAWVGQPGEAIPDAASTSLAGIAEARQDAPVAPVASAVTASAAPASAEAAEPAAGTAQSAATDRPRISPRASRLAASAGIDPRGITGTGPGGRIVERDVEAAVRQREGDATPVPMAETTAPASRDGAVPTLAPDAQADDDGAPMSRMRRTIAERLTRSWTTTPHFTVTVAVDVTRLLALRQELKAQGVPPSVTDFVAHATAQTLVEFPDLNARTDGTTVWRQPRVHLGLAVAVPGGLVVPVIRDADLLSVTGLGRRSAELIQGARAGTLGPDDLGGSTFTISNLGMFEVEEFSAIINPGESAILAVASALRTPVAFGEGIAIRSIMRLTLSADHRIVDGEVGARFLGALRRRLEDAEAFRNQALVTDA
jgi:pyruvate dehydrogenase E2 component (dihydrolipoamide acetyltransferase)